MADGTYKVNDVKNALTKLTTDTDSKIKTYQSQVFVTYTTLYNKVKGENERLSDTENKKKNEHSVDAQKSKYVELSQEIIKNVYNYAFWIYMVLSFILFVFVYKQPFSTLTKLALFVVIFGFPFYIYFLENLTYKICIYLYNVMLSTVYTNGYSNNNIEYSGEAMEEIMAETVRPEPLLPT